VVGAVATGAFVLWQLASQGHAAYNTRSDGLMWGLAIVTYDFLLMASVGLALVASLWTVFGLKDFAPTVRRALWLAIALLVGGVAALFLELGHPLRALYAIPLNLQVNAPLFWKMIGVAVYAICLAIVLFGWLATPQPGDRPGRGVSIVLLVSALVVVLSGALMYATLGMRPFWHSGELPVMILVEAVLAGLAFVLLFTHLAGDADPATRAATAGPLPRLAALLIAVTLLFLVMRMIVGLAANVDGLQVWDRIVASPAFWVQVACLAVALFLTASAAYRGNAGAQILATALVIVGLFIGKYEFVTGGQLVPLFKGSWVRGLIEYSPSAAEWAVLAMALFLAYAIYAFGAARFRLGAGR
jgi:molybdopterin-containing oxidoreductase family membrane subunit